MKNQIKLTTKSINGTSFHGSTVTASHNQLVKVLGKPQFVTNDGSDKVNIEWNCEVEGEVFTVYDWKEYRKIKLNEQIEWHIGGRSSIVTNHATRLIQEQL